ncbi:outer membrane beta-barrel protein [Methylobacterium sp. 77]|uniref:outer membrane protein n=1 Tax=Methylobacterium sp. 77 TaxID=1101192 RepID=UPI0012DDFA47|nr:outer membrane beta-barrel protein [Methylobacterium sp. 77]
MMIAPRTNRSAAVAALLAGLAIGTSAPVFAADLPPPPPPPPAPAPVQIGSGWYLRADFTESYYDHPKDSTLPDPNDPGMPPLVRLRLSHEAGYGGGVGYRFNNWLRMDATIDQRGPSRFSTYSSRSNFVTGYNIEAGKLDVLTGLVNVYADLGTWWGLTPYIGAGIGVADKSFRSAYTQTTCIIPACDGSPGAGPRTAAARRNGSVTSLAWALTGGVSYEIGAGFALDASYRYVNLGRAKTGLDDYGYGTRLKDLSANEMRVGLRYSFAGGTSSYGAGGYGGANPYE